MSAAASNFRRTADWLAACGKSPGTETASVQLGCVIEEFLELMCSFSWTIKGGTVAIDSQILRVFGDSLSEMNALATCVKRGSIVAQSCNRTQTLDALCDLEVTLNGVAFLSDFAKEAADQAVLASNEAKLVDGQPVILEGGKIGKPPGWQPPNLSEFV